MKSVKTIFKTSGAFQGFNRMLKSFIFFLMVLFTINTLGQNNYNWISNIDLIVQQTDSISNRSQSTFFLIKFRKNDERIKETWHYTEREGKVVLFQVRFFYGSTEFEEIYYLDKGRLICAEEYETEYTPDDDEIKWGGIYYFAGNSLRQRATLGQRKGNYNWNPGTETLTRFHQRFSELQKHIR